ncbi:hypothetical protein SAMD00019534_084090 [Acytostelium subglobosum LB1]|uniref:hypothetical protein n=1 Tax=Acytostelium subglobosum LB1 TaxID=1410327 RepID=UPI000644F66A|nr:hypothetical protein SAMD00019534_084090 [Acytostelium subglobosum LB1]GAM25234.1 hypothetical protein SAMD00019534_084090 [Acytostelium subglobosum LB1]|eukprot:XP_012751754.1 hypothetical protein SAMD00019534_084090 [Acytostelium subglobosum LB1]
MMDEELNIKLFNTLVYLLERCASLDKQLPSQSFFDDVVKTVEEARRSNFKATNIAFDLLPQVLNIANLFKYGWAIDIWSLLPVAISELGMGVITVKSFISHLLQRQQRGDVNINLFDFTQVCLRMPLVFPNLGLTFLFHRDFLNALVDTLDVDQMDALLPHYISLLIKRLDDGTEFYSNLVGIYGTELLEEPLDKWFLELPPDECTPGRLFYLVYMSNKSSSKLLSKNKQEVFE